MNIETKVLSAIGIVTVILVIGAVFFLSKPEKPVIFDASKLIKEDSNIMASGSAKLTIVEFGDYQCPACRMIHGPLKKAISEFPTQVSFVFRHFPLVQHKNAQLAAQAVEAAKLQGKLWEMHDKLYDSQDEWDEESSALQFFKKYAADLGIDSEKFINDINSNIVKEKVKNDLADGTSIGINSTPSLFFNGQPYKGGLNFEDFKKEIESFLK